MLEKGLDVGANFLLFGFRDPKGTDPALDACFGVSPGKVLREPLRCARWLCENVRFCRFAGAPGRVVCTFLRFRADCGLSSTAMGLEDLGDGVLTGTAVDVGGVGVGVSAGLV